MENKGKFWTLEDDQALLAGVRDADKEVAERLGRSVGSIRYRRAFLATLACRKSGATLEEGSERLGADLELVQRLWGEYDNLAGVVCDAVGLDVKEEDKDDIASLQELCKTLEHDCGGVDGCFCHERRLRCGDDRVWWEPSLVPWAIMYYPGVRAYADHCGHRRLGSGYKRGAHW